ncbi:GAF domain-containing protein [Antarcticirhabdus aurantiaca]|uniref:GAF domain-containing protein n=1 Tax=Antarcticirhabdus aurantiaca TaxID=2606717 RepID=A0ACD4NRC5_9HYPH|nr:GAF domain-containing protein [Antarcticirhabdus aurantiaca]WAJ29438.1 GAF domain-containing protein [Jeongeuplla avenae]
MSNCPSYPVPHDEEARLSALAAMAVINTPPDRAFDIIVDLAAHLFEAPIALVSLVGRDKQIFKARVGLDVCETSRDVSFCAHAITRRDEVLVVSDARRDPRFATNPLVTGAPHIRFYAGAPLIGIGGQPVGTLCIIDRVPRPDLSEHERTTLQKLARMVVLRMMTRDVIEANKARLMPLSA